MRASSASLNAGLFGDERRAEYESMFDQQLALSLSRGRGLGLADSIVRFLDGPGVSGAGSASASNAGGAGGAVPQPAQEALRPAQEALRPAQAAHSQAAHSQPPSAVPASALPESPHEFVAALWPHAERASHRLGVAPDVLVAQAALETGWGRHMMRDGAGRPALNLFGIKAGADWRGPRVNVSTLEFVGGVPERRREPFRAYASIAASFDDYVDFLQARSRYAPALAATTPEGYVRGLQAAGYATDPDYADKILAILERGLPGAPARGATPEGAPTPGAMAEGAPAPGAAATRPDRDQLARASADNGFEAGLDAGAGGDRS